MGKQNIDALLNERRELINKMYNYSDKLLAALQTGDLINAERYDYIREGCWEQIKYIDEKVNQTLKQAKKPVSFKEKILTEMSAALNKLTKTSQRVLAYASKIRNQIVQSTENIEKVKKDTAKESTSRKSKQPNIAEA
jgi:hypothetical protein